VRDYKKGKAILNSTFPSSNTSGSAHAASLSPKTLSGLHKVFDRIWQQVEKMVVVLRTSLFKDLGDMTLPLDIQERNIAYFICTCVVFIIVI
jgi:hypothetical protein